MQRLFFFAYGLVSYSLFFACFLFSIGFVGNLFVPKTIDSLAPGVSGAFTMEALLINLALLSVFAVQHSVMARPAFKRWWTKIVPQPIERATYVLFSTLALVLLYWAWQPMTAVVWSVDAEPARSAILAVYFFGWGLLLYATALIDHFDLFGLRQVTMHLRSKPHDRSSRFVTPQLYKLVRHPLYVGVADDLLGRADDDRRAPALHRDVHRLHPGRDPARRARSGGRVRRRVPRLPRDDADVDSQGGARTRPQHPPRTGSEPRLARPAGEAPTPILGASPPALGRNTRPSRAARPRADSKPRENSRTRP